jgi:putative membrane protein insertion efficiency factor
MTSVLLFVWLLPRNLCVLVLKLYRAVISPLYGDVCRYYPSCSAYALGAIQRHGVVKGVFLGALSFVRCHPWAAGGIDDVPPRRSKRHPVSADYRLTRAGFVVARRNPVPAGDRSRGGRNWLPTQRLQAVETQGKG